MGAEFTGIFQHNVELNQALRFNLNRNLGGTLNQVEDKISWVFERELGHSEEWRAFRVHQVTVLIVARLVAGVFVGPRFTRDDEWTNLSLGLAVDLVHARDAIKRWPTFLQPVAGPFLPEIRTVNRQITRMAEMLRPVISDSVLENSAAKRPLYDDEKIDLEDGDGESEGTFMSWMLDRLDTADPEILARAQLSCKHVCHIPNIEAYSFPKYLSLLSALPQTHCVLLCWTWLQDQSTQSHCEMKSKRSSNKIMYKKTKTEFYGSSNRV